MSLRDKYIKGIEALGGIEVKRTSKYIVFSAPEVMCEPGSKLLVYVGKRGAVRMGNNLEWSWPLMQSNKDFLIAAGESQ